MKFVEKGEDKFVIKELIQYFFSMQLYLTVKERFFLLVSVPFKTVIIKYQHILFSLKIILEFLVCQN